jgi:hypothetical protein
MGLLKDTGGTRIHDAVSSRERCELLIELGEAQSRMGEHEIAEESLRAAAALAEQLRDSALVTRIVLAVPALHWPGPGETNQLAVLLAQRGLVIELEDRSSRRILMARLAAELSYAPGNQGQCAELIATAMDQVPNETDPRYELYVRLYRDLMLRRPAQLSDRIANAEEVSRLAIQVGDYRACCAAALAKASSLTAIGDMAAAEISTEFVLGILPASEVVSSSGFSAGYRAYRAVMDGRFAVAWQEFGRCRAVAEAYNFPCLVDACWPAMLAPYTEEKWLAELESLAEDTVRRRRSVLVYTALLSWLKARLGRFADASYLLDRLAADRFENLSSSAEGLVGMAVLAEVCAALNRPDYSAILYERLLPYVGLNLALNAIAVLGSLARYVGVLCLTLGKLDEAISHFERSFCFNRRIGGRPWAIQSGVEFVSSLLRRGSAEDKARVLDLLSPLEAEAEGLKMAHALSKLAAFRELLGAGKLASTAICESTSMRMADSLMLVDRDGPINIADSTPVQDNANLESAPSDRSEDKPARNERVAIFCRSGEYWQIGYRESVLSVKHRRGLELISFLVRHPGREFFARELVQEGEVQSRGAHLKEVQIADNDSGPVLDAEAKRSYRERLTEIREEVEKLREANDIERAAKLEEEQDFLTRELARAIGLFGRDRKLGSEAERARKRVSIAITRAIRLISLHRDYFGRYLEYSIRTGNVCSYNPDPENPVRWIL